jgi:flagellar basal-body rod protein FlgG
MLRALTTAATGMEAQQLRIDVIANNLANSNTVGYKRSRAEFQDLLYQTRRKAGSEQAEGVQVPTGLQVGLGVRPMATQRVYTEGALKQTGGPLDLAIEGRGFFQVEEPNGDRGYTRAGNFKVNNEGRIVTSDGYPITPGILIPPESSSISVGIDGTVSVTMPGEVEPVRLGQIETAIFANPGGLSAQGRNLFHATAASGVASVGTSGSAGRGAIAQGTLEMANVQVVEEMVDLIVGQRAYEVNSKVVQAADEMLRSTAQLR